MTRRLIFVRIACIGSIALILAGFWFGKSIPFKEQWPLYEALRTTAAIIFAVVGAWLAIIYPERLRGSSRNQNNRVDKKNGEGLKKLLTPVAHSTAILCVILIIGVLAPIARQIPLFFEHATLIRSLSYGVLVSLTLWQLWTVVLTLIPADEIKRTSERMDRRETFLAPLSKLGSTAPKNNETHN